MYTAFTHRSLCTAFTHSEPSRREAPTQKSFYTEKLLNTESFYTQKLLHKEAFTQLLHTEALTQLLHSKPSTQKAFTQRSPYTEKRLDREAFTHTANFYTQKLSHTASFLHREDF